MLSASSFKFREQFLLFLLQFGFLGMTRLCLYGLPAAASSWRNRHPTQESCLTFSPEDWFCVAELAEQTLLHPQSTSSCT